MGPTSGRKADLFDNSSHRRQTDLFDIRNRKRRADTMNPTGHDRYDRYEPRQQAQHVYKSNFDLNEMLYPDRISQQKFFQVQNLIQKQDEEIYGLTMDLNACERALAKRNQEISACGHQIGLLRNRVEGLERENKRLDDGASSHKKLRERKDYLETQLKEKENLLATGKKVIDDQAERKRQLDEENARLRSTITERDATVSKLNEQVWKVTTASHDELTQIALEAQATQTLGMITGLKNEVQTRNKRVKDLEAEVKDMNGDLKAKKQAETELQREVEGVKTEVAKQKEEIEKEVKKTREAHAVANQQAGLIKRIMEENKRLARLDVL